jgi:ABC-2 type transport system ATP-binding protein
MIEARGITKFYGTFKALDDVSFHVNKGEVLGFLGPNGAGKSTTMKVLTTFISASEGTAMVDGCDVHAEPEKVRARLGYLPETPPLYGDMTVEDYLRFCGRARGLRGKNLEDRLMQVVGDISLEAKFKSPINELSKGYRQRTGIAQALIHDPPVLILDEPTSGLDPNQIIEIRKLIERLKQDKAIIFSTHILQEAAAVSSRMVIINGGKKIADGTTEQLASLATGTTRIKLLVLGNFAGLPQALKAVAGVASVQTVPAADGYARFSVEVKGSAKAAREICVDLGRLVVKCGLNVAELAPDTMSLEDVFLSLLQKGPRDSQQPDKRRQDFLSDAPPKDENATEMGLPSEMVQSAMVARNEDTPGDLPRIKPKSDLKPAEEEGGRA